MELKDKQILGYSKFRNKEGKERLVVDIVTLPNDFDKQYGRVGMKHEQLWIPEELHAKFNPTVVGKQIECNYTVNGRYANIVDVAFK